MISTAKKRIDWIDCAKGITIILVIAGHVFRNGTFGSLARGIIFSFHMPLFFILSSITTKYSKDESEFIGNIKKTSKHLLIPVIFIVFYGIIYKLFTDSSLISSFSYWKELLYSSIYASGVSVPFAGMDVPALGIPWFLMALFAGKTIFDFVQMVYSESPGKLFLICSVLSCLGILFGRSQWLILSFDIALGCQLFFYAGYKMKTVYLQKSTWEKTFISLFISLLVWLVTLIIEYPDIKIWTYLELAQRRYPLFPLCYITAICGTLFISFLSVILCRLKYLSQPLLFIGKNSFYLLLIHCIDFTWAKYWKIGGELRTAVYRIGTDLFIFGLLIIIKLLVGKKLR